MVFLSLFSPFECVNGLMGAVCKLKMAASRAAQL